MNSGHPFTYRLYLIVTAWFYAGLVVYSAQDRRWVQAPPYRYLRVLDGWLLIGGFALVALTAAVAPLTQSRTIARAAGLVAVTVNGLVFLTLATGWLLPDQGNPGPSYIGVSFWGYFTAIHFVIATTVPLSPYWWTRR